MDPQAKSCVSTWVVIGASAVAGAVALLISQRVFFTKMDSTKIPATSSPTSAQGDLSKTRRLEGRVTIVTGGASGIGAASARLFASEGAKVCLADINGEGVEAVAVSIREAGGQAISIHCDLTNADQVDRAVTKATNHFGPVTALFSHAGAAVVKPFLSIEENEWDKLMAVNVKSMFLMTKRVLPGMIDAGGGSIVCTSSVSAVYATPNEIAYCTSKGAVHMFARSIAVEFRDQNVRCNTICPGFVDTPHGRMEMAKLNDCGIPVDDDVVKGLQGRVCTPMECAAAALFLLSDDASFISGTHLFVDNALSAV